MAYVLKGVENPKQFEGAKKYTNAKGNTECVEFVRQTTGAPNTSIWKRGVRVKDAIQGEILPGTAIATFDDEGKYPTDPLGKLAAIFLSKDENSIKVLDQWKAQGGVLPREIQFNSSKAKSRSNNGDTFYVIE